MAEELSTISAHMLSDHFSLAEIEFSSTALRCGIENKLPAEMFSFWHLCCERFLEPIRQACAFQIRVTSGYRCAALNKKKGGATTSEHLGMHGNYHAAAFDLVPSVWPASYISAMKELWRFCFEGTTRDLGIVAIRPDQLVWEFGDNFQPAWIHLGFTAGMARREVLRSEWHRNWMGKRERVYSLYDWAPGAEEIGRLVFMTPVKRPELSKKGGVR
jgi:hypothetical protein